MCTASVCSTPSDFWLYWTVPGLVLVDIAPKVESSGTAEIMAFMHSGLDGFASLDNDVAASRH